MSTVAYTSDPGAPHYIPPTMRVYVNGNLDARWKPKRIDWRCNGEVSTMTISRILGVETAAGVQELPESHSTGGLITGDTVQLVDSRTSREWFFGTALQRPHLIQADADRETLEWIVYGPEIRLQHTPVLSQWGKKTRIDGYEVAGILAVGDAVRSETIQNDQPVIFNPKNRPNATAYNYWKLDSDAAHYAPDLINSGGRCFDGVDRVTHPGQSGMVAVKWDLFNALRSIVEYIDRYNTVHWEAVLWPRILFVLGTTEIGQVDVSELSLLASMQKLLSSAGFGFYLEPWSVGGLGDHRLHVFNLATGHMGWSPELAEIPSPGGSVSVSSVKGKRAVVKRLNFARDAHRTTPTVKVFGSPERRQVGLLFGGGDPVANWDLVPMWDPDAYPIAQWMVGGDFFTAMADDKKVGGDRFSDRHNTDGDKFRSYKHHFRSFTLNEDGIADHLTTHGFFDPTAYGLGDTRLPRRPYSLTETIDGRTLIPAHVQLWLTDKAGNFIKESLITPSGWRVWKNGRCGFDFTSKVLGGIGGKDPIGYRPWKNAAIGNQPLFNRAGHTVNANWDTYGSVVYMDVLDNAIRQVPNSYKLRILFWCSLETSRHFNYQSIRNHSSRGVLTFERALRRPRQFGFTTVRNQYDVLNPRGIGGFRNDSVPLAIYTSALADKLGTEVGHTSIVLRHLSREYAPGDRIPATSGRVNDLSLGTGLSDAAPVIRGISWSFGEENHTELAMDSATLSLSNPRYPSPVTP